MTKQEEQDLEDEYTSDDNHHKGKYFDVEMIRENNENKQTNQKSKYKLTFIKEKNLKITQTIF